MKPFEWIDSSYSRIVTRYEAFWVFVSCVVTVLLTLLFFGTQAFSTYITFNFHNAGLSIPGMTIFLGIFMLVNVIVFFIKNRIPATETTMGYWIILISGLLSLVFLEANISMATPLVAPGWSIYPPFPKTAPDVFTAFMLDSIASILRVAQLVVVIMMLLAVYRWGKRSAKPRHHGDA